MMNATAVLPAGAAMAFAGNAAAISDNSAPGGFSDTLGAMVTGGKQSGMSSAIRANAEEQTALSGEILSGLTELEQSAEELKQLLKTAELAGYLQGAMVQTVSDIPTADNAELMQILAGNDGVQSVVQTVVQNGTDQTDIRQTDVYAVQMPMNSEILARDSENSLAENPDVLSGKALDTKSTGEGYIADKDISGGIETTISEEAANSGSLSDRNIKRKTYDPDVSIGDVSKNIDHIVAGSSEENVAVSRPVAGTDESASEDIAVIGKDDSVNAGSRALDLNAAEKSDNVGTDAVSGEEIRKDIMTISYEKSVGAVTHEAENKAAAEADNVPRVAYAKRNVEVKSEELKAITKGNEVTKPDSDFVEVKSNELKTTTKGNEVTTSDSDLDIEQKVTDKNAASGMGARSADIFARTESRFDDDGQPAQTVRVPISDMASFVSEHAPKANGKSTLTVVLTPETLGKITVRMVNESGKLSVEILTETQAAKELLQAKSGQLAYALRNDDVELASYKVETSQAELFQRDFDGSSKNPYRQQSHSRQKDDTDDFDNMLSEIQAMG